MSVDRARPAADTWPLPGTVKFRLELDDNDGETCRRFSPAGGVEVTLVASEKPVDADGLDGYKCVILPLAFPNYPVARRHAERLELLTGALTAALDEAQADAAAAIPSRDDGHAHVVRFARYARALPFVAECEVCMCELVPDVHAWAAERGLLGNAAGIHTRQMLDARRGTIKAALEQAFNPAGGLANG